MPRNERFTWRTGALDEYHRELSVTIHRPRHAGDLVRAATEEDIALAGFVPKAKLDAAYAMLRANGIKTP